MRSPDLREQLEAGRQGNRAKGIHGIGCSQKKPSAECWCQRQRIPLNRVPGWDAPDPDEAALRREVLASARAYIARRKAEEARPQIMRQDLMRELRTGFNLSCSLLEELAAAGELEAIRTTGGLQAFIPAAPAQPVGRGYALPLSQKEASALLRLFEVLGGGAQVNEVLVPGDLTTLREVRSRLKGGPL